MSYTEHASSMMSQVLASGEVDSVSITEQVPRKSLIDCIIHPYNVASSINTVYYNKGYLSMNIIYRITNIVKEQNNVYPCYYIGSKKNYKGLGSYWGSSKHPIMIQELKETPENFKFEVLLIVKDAKDLIKFENAYQHKVNAVKSEKYYNITYAGRTTIDNKWMTNGEIDLTVPPEKVPLFEKLGYYFGRSKMKGRKAWNTGTKATAERSANMSKAIKGRVPWNKGKQTGQDPAMKPMMQSYKAVNVITGEERIISLVGQNKEFCKLIKRQYQTVWHHLNRRDDGFDPNPINGYKMYRI